MRCLRCSAPEISRGRMLLRRVSCAQALFARIIIRSALPSIFSAAVFSGAVPVVSVGVEDEDGAVFAADLDRFAGVGALAEQVEAGLRLVGRDSFADGRENFE